MRRNELSTGITVSTRDGASLGASQAAAKRALFETAVTRYAIALRLVMLLFTSVPVVPVVIVIPIERVCVATFQT